MRPRTRLDFEVHGNVAEGNGGRGKISRQRPESAGSPNWAAPPEASKPLALSYIPEILESMATMCSGAERRSLGGLAPVSTETNSIETPLLKLKRRVSAGQVRRLKNDHPTIQDNFC